MTIFGRLFNREDFDDDYCEDDNNDSKPENVKVSYAKQQDIKNINRTLNILLVNNYILLKESVNLVNSEYIPLFKEICDDNYAIGGSHILKMYDLIDRKPDDIDLFTNIPLDEEKLISKFGKNIELINSSRDRVKIKYKEYIIDIFYDASLKFKSQFGFNYVSPLLSLNIKGKYNRLKDYNDFLHIQKKFDIKTINF
jgi:hypothetical protein